MALQINDKSYIGKFASAYWTPVLFEMDTVKKGVINVIDSVKKTLNIGNIDFTGGLQPRQAVPTTDNGSWTVDKKTITPKDAMLYTRFNPRDLEDHWEAENLSELLLERKLPVEFEAYAMYMMMGRVFEQLETGIWQASTGYSTITDTTDSRYNIQFFDGIIKQLINDSSVLNYASPATITTSNILTFLDGLLSLIVINKKGLISKDSSFKRMKYLMSPNTWLIYTQALVNTTYKGINFPEKGTPVWKGYGIEVLNGIPDNTILFGEFVSSFDGALHIAYNSKDDENTIEMKKWRPEAELYFVKALLKMDIQYKYGNEIAMMTTLTAANFVA